MHFIIINPSKIFSIKFFFISTLDFFSDFVAVSLAVGQTFSFWSHQFIENPMLFAGIQTSMNHKNKKDDCFFTFFSYCSDNYIFFHRLQIEEESTRIIGYGSQFIQRITSDEKKWRQTNVDR